MSEGEGGKISISSLAESEIYAKFERSFCGELLQIQGNLLQLEQFTVLELFSILTIK